MEGLRLYRRRIIPSECILLKDDILLHRDNETIITKWKTLHPKKTLSHGYSCYFPERGIKVSKFYDHEDQLISWYCDIIETSFSQEEEIDTYIFTDLLADVVIHPSGRVKVVDLDELADALEKGLITQEQTSNCLRQLNNLLVTIQRDKFDTLSEYLDSRGL